MQVNNKALQIPGRCLLGVCQQLSASLGEQAAFLLEFHGLVVASLKGQGATSPGSSESTRDDQLQQQMPKLKALAGGGSNTVQQLPTEGTTL